MRKNSNNFIFRTFFVNFQEEYNDGAPYTISELVYNIITNYNNLQSPEQAISPEPDDIQCIHIQMFAMATLFKTLLSVNKTKRRNGGGGGGGGNSSEINNNINDSGES